MLKRIFGYVWPYKKELVVAVALLPVISLFEIAQPYLLKKAIDEHIAVGRLAGLDRVGLAYLGVLLGQYVSSFAQIYLTQLIGQRGMNTLRVRVHEHVLSLSASFFDRTPVGRLMTRMTSDIEALSEMFASGLVSLLGDIIRLVFILVAIFGIDWKLALFSMGTAPVLFGVAAFFRRWVRDAFREIRTKLARMNAFLQEHLSGIKVVQAFAQESRIDREFDVINVDYRRANARAIIADAALYSIVEAVGAIAVAGLLWHGGNRIAGGTLTFGVLVAFVEYLGKFFAPIRDLSTKYTVMQQAMAAAERVFTLLDTVEPDAPRVGSAATGPTPSQPPHRARPRHLRLPRRSPRARRRVALDRGRRDAGHRRRHRRRQVDHHQAAPAALRPAGGDDPDRRRRRADARQAGAAAAHRRRQPGRLHVLGHAARQHRARRRGADGRAAPEAARRVGADRVIASRPDGLDAKVVERGANFSGGERQLIAFARALARDPEILVLDEATASVDPETERVIERGIGELMRGRTSIVIAHRLSTVQRASRIVVIHRGHVAEEGTHDELLAGERALRPPLPAPDGRAHRVGPRRPSSGIEQNGRFPRIIRGPAA